MSKRNIKRKFSFLLSLSLIIAVLAGLSGCGMFFNKQTNPLKEYDYSEMKLVQLEAPYENQLIAIITTDLGIIKIALYPEYAPNAVENFVSLAKAGFYDGKPIDGLYLYEEESVLENNGENKNKPQPALFAAGAYYPNEEDEDLYEGVSPEKTFPNEYSVCMWTFKGALGSYSDIAGESGSRFFVINETEFTDEQLEALREIKQDGKQLLPDELLFALRDKGCAVTLSGSCTIFGQTYEGIDVVEAICASPANEYGLLLEPVFIKKIEIENY